MRNRLLPLAGGLLTAALLTLLTACGGDDGTVSVTEAGRGGTGNDPSRSTSPSTSSELDIRPTTTPEPGDCVGVDRAGNGGQVWVVDCDHRNAVARVIRQVPTGQSITCTTRDDAVGWDFSNDKPSLCLMLYGQEGDCYSDFTERMASGPRVSCTDPKATLRVQRVLYGAGRDTCRQLAPHADPNATALTYTDVPDFDATKKTDRKPHTREKHPPTPETTHDITYCLTSPNKASKRS